MKAKFFILLIFVFIISLFPNCAKTPEQKQLVKTGKKELKIKLEGVVRPSRKVKIIALSTGTVEKVFFANGDWINEGEIIYKLKNRELETQIQNLKNEIALIDEQLISNRNLYYSAKRVKSRLIEIAKTQLNRIAELYANNCATKREVELAEEKYFRLIDEQKAITDNYITRKNTLIQQKKQKLATLKTLELQLENSIIRSPISGYLSGLNVYAGQEVTKGSVVGYVLNLDKVIVKAGIASGLYRFIKKGQKVKIDFITTPPYKTEAKITRVIPVVDPKIGRMTIEIELDNYNYILQDGTKAIVTIIPSKKEQNILYKYFYEKGKSEIEIKTKIK